MRFIVALALALLATPASGQSVQDSGFISWDEMRAKGHLDTYPGSLMFCDDLYNCRAMGQYDAENRITWDESVSMDDLKVALQGLLDMQRYQSNRMLRAYGATNDPPP